MGDSTLSRIGPYVVDAPHVLVRPRQARFVHEQNAGTLVRTTWALYRTHFSPLLLGYVLPMLTLFVMQEVGAVYRIGWLVLSALLAGVPLAFVASSATTLMISDICLGNSPSLRRSYGKLFERRLWLNVLGTVLLQGIVVLFGFLPFVLALIVMIKLMFSATIVVLFGLLLVVPGLIVMIKLMFSTTIVVLERLSGYRALKRSIALVKGHFWRVLGNVCLLVTLLTSALLTLLMVTTVPLMWLKASNANRELAMLQSVLIGAFIYGLFYPVLFIAIILLYYDLRVRKEAYDVTILAEDMMR
jgi:hypothetical protein